MVIAAFCLVYAGFSALCVAMDRHFEDLFDRAIPRQLRRCLRVAGWFALVLALYLSAQVWGWSYGLVEWIGMASIAGLILIWFVTFRPHAAIILGGVCALAAPLFAISWS